MNAFVLGALLACAQTVELDVAEPFKQSSLIGYALSAYGDWDRDGHADLLISAPHIAGESKATVALVSGHNGRGLLVWRSAGRTELFGRSLGRCADLDGDALPEVVIGRRVGSLVCSSKDGKTLYELADSSPAAIHDVDDDGRCDWLLRTLGRGNGRVRLEIASGKSGATLRALVEDRADYAERAVIATGGKPSHVALAAVACEVPEVATAVVEVVSLADGIAAAKRTFDFEVERVGRVGAFASEQPGIRVCPTADLDRDGASDILLSLFDDTPTSDQPREGPAHSEVLVLSGRDLSTLRPLTAEHSVARFGYALASGGDVNADGFEDQLVSEYGDTFRNDPFVVRLYSGANGQLLREQLRDDNFGARLIFVGDTDGDAAADYAVTTLYAEVGSTEPGSVVLLSGKSGALLRTWKR